MTRDDDTPDRPCAYHPDVPSIAVCAECDADVCGGCHDADDRGYAICPACRDVAPGRPSAWGNEGSGYSPTAYATTLWRLLRHPRSFYGSLPDRGPWMPPLVFGTLTVVVGLLASRGWSLALEPGFTESLTQFADLETLSQTELQIAILASTPLSAGLAVGAHVAALRASVTVAGADIAWSRLARIAGYALGAYVFLLVPPVQGLELGRFLAVFWIFNLEANALETYADFGPWTATATVAFPVLVLMICGA